MMSLGHICIPLLCNFFLEIGFYFCTNIFQHLCSLRWLNDYSVVEIKKTTEKKKKRIQTFDEDVFCFSILRMKCVGGLDYFISFLIPFSIEQSTQSLISFSKR